MIKYNRTIVFSAIFCSIFLISCGKKSKRPTATIPATAKILLNEEKNANIQEAPAQETTHGQELTPESPKNPEGTNQQLSRSSIVKLFSDFSPELLSDVKMSKDLQQILKGLDINVKTTNDKNLELELNLAALELKLTSDGYASPTGDVMFIKYLATASHTKVQKEWLPFKFQSLEGQTVSPNEFESLDTAGFIGKVEGRCFNSKCSDLLVRISSSKLTIDNSNKAQVAYAVFKKNNSGEAYKITLSSNAKNWLTFSEIKAHLDKFKKYYIFFDDITNKFTLVIEKVLLLGKAYKEIGIAVENHYMFLESDLADFEKKRKDNRKEYSISPYLAGNKSPQDLATQASVIEAFNYTIKEKREEKTKHEKVKHGLEEIQNKLTNGTSTVLSILKSFNDQMQEIKNLSNFSDGKTPSDFVSFVKDALRLDVKKWISDEITNERLSLVDSATSTQEELWIENLKWDYIMTLKLTQMKEEPNNITKAGATTVIVNIKDRQYPPEPAYSPNDFATDKINKLKLLLGEIHSGLKEIRETATYENLVGSMTLDESL